MQEEVRGGWRSNILRPPIRVFLNVGAACGRWWEEKVEEAEGGGKM